MKYQIENEKSDRQFRKVQSITGTNSLLIILPVAYSTKLGLMKGDYLKVNLHNNKLVMEKA